MATKTERKQDRVIQAQSDRIKKTEDLVRILWDHLDFTEEIDGLRITEGNPFGMQPTHEQAELLRSIVFTN